MTKIVKKPIHPLKFNLGAVKFEDRKLYLIENERGLS
tara:strand:- start:113567 stop:113677 length:111 start_codon:yes stop_codon:yes gene_type:complete